MTAFAACGSSAIARLAAALDLVPVATLLLDGTGRRALAGNAEAASLLACRRDRLPVVWLRSAGQVLRLRLAGLGTAEATEVFDGWLTPPGAPPRAVLVRARRVEAEGLSLISVGLVDVTRRQDAEAGLAMANRRLEIALAGAELGAWQRDLRTEELRVTARWCAMLGLPARESVVTMADWERMIHPADLPALRARIGEHFAGRTERYEAEFRLRHAEGHWIPVLARGEVIERDAAGNPLVITGTHFDLSAQRASEAGREASEREARRSLAELEMLYRTAPLGLAQLDRALRFVRVNEALAEMNGHAVEAHLGRSAWDLVPDLRSAAEPLLRQVVEQGEAVTGIELSGETPKAPGLRRSWTEQFYPVRDPGTQEIIGVGIVCEEVTERRRAERTRELLLRELDHRVKNLFAVMGGLVAFSARSAASPLAMREALTGRIGALARAHDLVRPAMAGDTRRGPATTLRALLRALLAPFQAGEGLPERLHLDGPGLPLGPVAAPPIALALHELATNAAKYGALSREGGQVAVAWASQDGTLLLRWREHGGPGLAGPAIAGFGHRLVAQSAAQLGGQAGFHWAPEGLQVELLLPVGRLAA